MMHSDRWQARSARVSRQGRRRPAGWLLAAALAGCGTPSLDPAIGWWHQLEGGTIAEQRPPPPGIGQPFPHVFTTPGRPTLPDAAARIALTDRLAAGRDAAERVGARDPLPAPGTAVAAALASAPAAAVAPPAPGAPPGPGPAPAGQPPAAPSPSASATRTPAAVPNALPATAPPPATATGPSATFAAAEAPAPPSRTVPPPRTPAPARAGAPTATAATPAELQALARVAPASGTPLAVAGADADGGPLPAIPPAPPPPPSFADVVALPAATPPPPLPAAVPLAARGTPVRFLAGTATLAAGQAGALHALAGQRAGGAMVAIGYGDSGADAPTAQAGALDLALRRAEAIAAVLGTYGVPASAIRVSAEAFGRGGAVRLLH